MKTTAKWILGIVVGLVVVTAVSALAIFAMTQWGSLGWMANQHSFLPRSFERTMPMHPYADGPWFFMSRFNPLWFIGRSLLWFGVSASLVLGIIAMVCLLNKPGRTAVVVNPATVQPADQASPIQSLQNCPSCSRVVQEDWSHCPYCGHNLATSA